MKLRISSNVSCLRPGIRRCRADFGKQLVLLERRRDRHRQDVLREHVERAGAEDFGVELAIVDRIERGARLEIFEAVAGDDDALARLIEPVVGAADPLQQARAALGRAHLDDEVDVAPVDPEVEAGGGDQPAQLPAAIAASTLRRASTDRLPWWMPIGRP